MSKERQRARAAREEARRVQVAAAARKRDRAARRRALVPALPRRRRRYGALSTSLLVRLVVAWFAVQALVWILVPGFEARAGFAVLSAAVLAVAVATRRSSTR